MTVSSCTHLVKCVLFQAEGSKLQRDLRAYLEAVKGETDTDDCIIIMYLFQFNFLFFFVFANVLHGVYVLLHSHARVLEERAGVPG